MWLGVAIGITIAFGFGYLVWQEDWRNAVVAGVLALILGIVWLCCVWAQEGLDAENNAKEAEEKAYYEKCIVETRHEVKGKLQSYSKIDTCIK
jgi:signal transduction histidine kinase